jgi:RNA polymerase sigma-70 factor (ECF subfamily)
MPPDVTNFLTPSVYLLQDAEDKALVLRCLAGDTSAFEPLVLRYQRPFFTVALRMLGDRSDASDVVQNAFVKAYEHLDRFDRAQRFFSWAYRILVNECLNARRSRRIHEPISDDAAGSAGCPLEACEASERRQRVQAALLQLSPEYRQVIVLRHFTELAYEEIGEVLGIPVKTVKSRLHTARQRLAGLLLEWDIRK